MVDGGGTKRRRNKKPAAPFLTESTCSRDPDQGNEATGKAIVRPAVRRTQAICGRESGGALKCPPHSKIVGGRSAIKESRRAAAIVVTGVTAATNYERNIIFGRCKKMPAING